MANVNATIHTLQNFYSTIKNKGVRTVNQFAIEFPSNAGFDPSLTVFAQSANLPGRQVLAENVPYFGFPFKVITNLTYTQEWPMTIRCDTEMEIRKAFENWANQFASLSRNTGGQKGQAPGINDCMIHLLGNDMSSVIRSYKLFGAFCQDIGNVDFDHSGTGISTFNVNIGFQYWEGADKNGNIKDPLA